MATESVIETAPFRRHELHGPAIELHYWIDLLLEGPLPAAVVAPGVFLAHTTTPKASPGRDIASMIAVRIRFFGRTELYPRYGHVAV